MKENNMEARFMNKRFKKLTPDLMVSDVGEAVKFYTEKLGFKLDMLVPDNEKTIENKLTDNKKYAYAMVSRDEVFVMFMHKDAYVQDIPELKNVPIGASLTLYYDVDDVEELYESFKKQGVEIAKDISTTWYGMKEFYVRDCNGYILGFAERIK
jgi:uncharacterized glyoxalase superfamily protein PhnB